jgi:LPXTG-motif cell wall-anchored protein
MRHRRRLALALVSMAATAAGAAFAAPALAADPTPDPAGANGTVKIDGPEFQLDNRNEPHVTCEFQVEFFDLDEGERGTLIFEAQPPSSKDFHEVGRLEDQLLSDDAATGGAYTRDPDEVFSYPGDIELDLTDADLHKNQGYHIKLTVDRDNHPNWTEKHKVFWLEPCPPSPTPSESSPTSPTTPPTSPTTPPISPTKPPGGLAVTGVATTSIALTGIALIGGGAALLWFRRRRDNVTFES